MPERIEIQIMIENLNKKYKDTTLLNINICSGRYKKHGSPKDYTKFIKLLPLKIKKFNVKGKFIWLTFHDSPWIIYFTLGLTGHFKYDENGKYCRYQFLLDKGKFCMDDMRNFGTLSFTNDKSFLNNKLDKLGIDVFSKDFTYKNFKKIISGIKEDKLIGMILLEQRYISGIGNYLRADMLYTAKISPFRTIRSLQIKDIKILFSSIRKVINESYKQQKKYGLHGYDFLVYKKKKTKQNEEVSHDLIGKRHIYWVKSVQK